MVSWRRRVRYDACVGGSRPKSENRGEDLNPKKRNVRREQLILKTYSATVISFGWLVLVVFFRNYRHTDNILLEAGHHPYAPSCKAAPSKLGAAKKFGFPGISLLEKFREMEIFGKWGKFRKLYGNYSVVSSFEKSLKKPSARGVLGPGNSFFFRNLVTASEILSRTPESRKR